MGASDARFIPIRHKAYRVTFPLVDGNGDLVIGATSLDSERSKDGAAFSDCTNETTHIAEGMYYLDLTAEEMDADTVSIVVKSSGATAAKTMPIVLYPQQTDDLLTGLVRIVEGNSLVGRTGLTSGKIVSDASGYPEYAAIFTSGGDNLEYDPNQLVGAIIQDLGSEGNEPHGRYFVILGGYFFNDSTDVTEKVFGIAIDERFGCVEDGVVIINNNWGGTDLVEGGNGNGWTFIVAKVAEADASYPAPGHALDVWINPSIIRDAMLPVDFDAVYFKQGSTDTGVFYPAGKPERPVGDIDDAVLIANYRRIKRIFLGWSSSVSFETFGTGANFLHFIGNTTVRPDGTGGGLNFGSKSFESCIFENLLVTGTKIAGSCIFRRCYVKALQVNGDEVFEECIVTGAFVGGASSNWFRKCTFGIPWSSAASYNENGGSAAATFMDCHGKLKITNNTSSIIYIYGFQGELEIDSSCTGGTINIVGGSGKLIDNNGGATVNVEGFQMSDADSVYFDTNSGISGSDYPDGLPNTPVNDIDDAVAIAVARKLSIIYVSMHAAHSFDAGASRMRFIGTGNTLWSLDLNGQVISYCYFEKIAIQGFSAGTSQNTYFLCTVTGWSGRQGDVFISCQLAGTLQPYAKEKFVNCGFGINGNVIFDFNTNWQSGPEYLNIQGCNGSITLRNLTIDSDIMIEGFKGDITIDATCTAGTINIRGGSGRLNDNSAGATVNVDGFFEGEEVADLTALLAQVNDIKSIVSKGHYQGISWYVDPGAVSGNNTGVSWEDAFLTGEAAMAVAQWGDYIFVRVSNSPDSGSREFDEDWNVPKGVTVIGCPGATDYLYRNSNIRLAGNSSYPAQPILTLNEGARIERIRVEARVDTKDNINLIEMRRFAVMRRCTIGDIIFASIQSNILCVKEDFARIEHVRFELNNLYTGKYAIVIEGNRGWLKDCDFSGTQNNDIIHINGGNYSHIEGNAFQGIGAGYAAIRITTGVGSNINTNAWSKEIAGSTAKFLNDVGGSETLDFNNNEYATRVTQRDMENIIASAGNTGRRLLKISSEYYEVVPYDDAAGAYTHRRRKLRSGDSVPGTPITVIPANSIQHFGSWADCNADGTT
jgi:hypothetical protein